MKKASQVKGKCWETSQVALMSIVFPHMLGSAEKKWDRVSVMLK